MATELERFMSKVEGTIHDIDVFVLRTKKQMGESLSRVIDGTFKFADVWLLVTVLSVHVVGSLIIASQMGWAMAARAFIKKVVGVTATFLASAGVQLLISTHKLLSAVWVEYRNTFKGINAAMAGLSSSLGYAMEYIPLALQNVANLEIAVGALAGKDPYEYQIRYLKSYAVFLSDLDVQFDKYAANPQAILDDINQWISDNAYRPAADRFREVFDTFKAINAEIGRKASQLADVEGALNKLIFDLPAQQFESWQKYYGPIHKQITDIQNQYVIPTLEFLDAVVEQLDLLTRANGITLAEYQAMFSDVFDVFSGFPFGWDEISDWRQKAFAWLVDKAGEMNDKQKADNVRNQLEATIRKPDLLYIETPVTPDPAPLPITIKPLPVAPVYTGTVYTGAVGSIIETGNNLIIEAAGGNIK